MANRADELWTVWGRVNTVQSLSSQDLRNVEDIFLMPQGFRTRSSSSPTRTSSPGSSTSSSSSSECLYHRRWGNQFIEHVDGLKQFFSSLQQQKNVPRFYSWSWIPTFGVPSHLMQIFELIWFLLDILFWSYPAGITKMKGSSIALSGLISAGSLESYTLQPHLSTVQWPGREVPPLS